MALGSLASTPISWLILCRLQSRNRNVILQLHLSQYSVDIRVVKRASELAHVFLLA